MKTTFRNLICLFVLCLFSSVASAGIVVIVNPANKGTIDKDAIARIYLAKSKTFPDGTTALPLDRKEGSKIREQFVTKVLGKDENQLKAYWSRLIFTGRGVPPKELATDAEVKQVVSRNPNAIGYIDSSAVDSSVKVVAEY